MPGMGMEENQIRRVLPHNEDAERSVLGSMIMDRDAIVAAGEYLTGEDFYNRSYGILYDTMVELEQAGEPVDLVTLQNRLREKNVPPEVSSLEYMQRLIDAVPTSDNVIGIVIRRVAGPVRIGAMRNNV